MGPRGAALRLENSSQSETAEQSGHIAKEAAHQTGHAAGAGPGICRDGRTNTDTLCHGRAGKAAGESESAGEGRQLPSLLVILVSFWLEPLDGGEPSRRTLESTCSRDNCILGLQA